MNTTKQLANRFREVILNGKWIANTNYKQELSDINWKQATTKVETLNTIADLTFHVNYYITGILNVFNGGSLDIRDKYSFDMPPIKSDKEWEELTNTLWKNSELFATQIELITDRKLEEVFVDKKYGSYQRNIDALIEHSYYHLGQITLIKKLLLQKGEIS